MGILKNTMPIIDPTDIAGRYLLDHLVEIGCLSPEKRGVIRTVFHTLVAAGYQFSNASIDAAIQSHNHQLLDYLMTQNKEHPVEALTWTAIHYRNVYALRYAVVKAEHWQEVALHDDTRFLGQMLSMYHNRHYHRTSVMPAKIWEAPLIEIAPFALMLADEHDLGRDGFRWLLRNGFIDGDTVNAYHRAQIEARYGKHALKYLE